MTRNSPAAAAFALPVAAALWIAAGPASAQTSTIGSKEKMETCKIGAAEQQLKGRAEQDFIRKCMANEPAAKSPATSPGNSTGATPPAK